MPRPLRLTKLLALLTMVLGSDYNPEVVSLSELPLDRLLHVKRALMEDVEITAEDSPEIADNDVPAALPLRGDKGRLRGKKTHPYRRGYTEVEDGWKAKGDIQSIFQTTVTALAFLAFGGYLICMIISAIRTTNPQMTTMMTMTTMAPIAPRRHQRDIISNRRVSVTGTMFNALQTLAEGYEKYNQQCQKMTCH